jgi:hypothetical protein
MSLPMVYPATAPSALSTTASSGSGTSTVESARTDTGAPGPLTRQAADLKNSSGRSAAYTRS